MPPDSGDLRVEYADLATLVRAPRNPKEHDLGALHASLGRFGFVAPILMDEASGRLVAGHGRVDALQQLKAAGRPAPARVRVRGDRWEVPVIRGVAFASPVEAESYLVADNQTTMLGGWDSARLAEVLSDLAAQQALAGTGFDQEAVDELLRDVGGGGARGIEATALGMTPMEPMICKAYCDDDGHIVIEAVGGGWEGCMSHGETLQEAFVHFGEAAAAFAEARHRQGAP